MVLGPIYESDFQPHSYGFRKGRCTMDAIAVLMPSFNSRIKRFYVIEGDLESYFDTVNHRKLIRILKRRIGDRRMIDLIWKFLKAGVMEGKLFAKLRREFLKAAFSRPFYRTSISTSSTSGQTRDGIVYTSTGA